MILLAFWLAAATLEDAPAYLDAVATYERVELEDAQLRFSTLLPLATTDRERALLHAWQGLIEGQLGAEDRARVQLKLAVELDRDVKLPRPAPPEVEGMLEEERRAVLARSAATAAPAPIAPDPGLPPPAIARVALVGVGGALVLAGAAVVALGVDTVFRQATDPTLFNDEAHALVNVGYAEYAAGGALAGVGALALGAGVAWWVLE